MTIKKNIKKIDNKLEASRVSSQSTKSKATKTQIKTTAVRKPAPKTKQTKSTPNKHVGEIWRGETKYIDTEPKRQRDYVVVIDNGKSQTVSKVKSIKIFDKNDKNADKALVEINATRYGLEQRSGVDNETFNKNRMSGKPLTISDKRVFPETKPRAKLGSHDTNRVLRHTGRLSKPHNNKKKEIARATSSLNSRRYPAETNRH